ncbi:HD domain-containing phosphohydrolase [Pararobbsia silviterrae]|uniref:HAMP domain-containing protein n=1 Tax=Pararobbsia silviterrae TaxID=1792498 RepID=A0A494XZK4_9BURK|nr:HD domain-containing phosphohydrolase [Pararobbsia silviterrae]RKP53541.1 HAMP domain-containing protein [Pararobbsia silviterrae]
MTRYRHLPFQLHVSLLTAVVVLFVGGLISALDFNHLRARLEADSVNQARGMSRETTDRIQKTLGPAEVAVKMIAHSKLSEAWTLDDRMAFAGMLHEILTSAPDIRSLYVGYDNGDIFMVLAMRNDTQRAAMQAPPGTQFVVHNVSHDESADNNTLIYIDKDFHIISTVDNSDVAAHYDPRKRPWYQQARQAKRFVRTEPYRFFSVPEIGTTLAITSADGRAVAACDISLDSLQQMLVAQQTLPGRVLALVDPNGNVLTSNLAGFASMGRAPDGTPRAMSASDMQRAPILEHLIETLRSAGMREWIRNVTDQNGTAWYTSVSRLTIDEADPLFMVSAIRSGELMQAAVHAQIVDVLITLAILVLSLPVIWVLAGSVAKPLKELTAQADTMRRFDPNPSQHVLRSRISELDRLAVQMAAMKRTIRRFLGTIRAVAGEPEFEPLVRVLLTEILAEAHADAGVLYLTDHDGEQLLPTSALDARTGETVAGLSSLVIADAPVLIRSALADNVPRTGQLSNADILQTGYAEFMLGAGHAAVVPLVNRQKLLVGVFVLLHSRPLEQMQMSFISELTSLFVSAIETRELIKSQRELFDSFIQLIAKAIDAKSPYTGGHCNRVPELMRMLAQAACDTHDGPWKDFSLNALQWEELHVAAWLHDCGKITTPEYVVDKATKLETLYDRIHEIRMRFEVLKCHAEIDCLKSIEAGVDRAAAEAKRDASLRELDEEFAFIAQCNEGGESMDAADAARLARIAERTWVRTLDDRLGVSYDERQRKEREPAVPLPAREKLLADKVEHRFVRNASSDLIGAPDNPWGFRIKMPELLYNRGELHNLSVSRGTLSEEERFKINEHILQTIVMLSQLPFPRHMRNIPEIAGGHHERMDGAGYPMGLKREQMSPLARMMAIVDIFEALTAGDRPYKKGKTLSESIRIMARMKDGHHIDPDVFELFLRSGVYRDYASRFMDVEQIDDVDIAQYLEAAPDPELVA